MFKKKLIKVASIVFASLLVILCTSVNTFATNDNNVGFTFNIKSYQANTRVLWEKRRMRDTKNPKDMWKVNLKTSGEGAGTITNFWLEDYSGTNVSADIPAKQGAGEYYKVAYKNAGGINVFLTAENNGWDSITYSASGIWDEETQVYG